MKTKDNQENKKITEKASIMDHFYLILIIFLIVLNIVFIGKVINREDRVPTIFGIRPFVIISGSMQPQIKVGDMVLIDTNDTDYEVGDIIAFKEGTSIIVHRINEIVDVDGQTKYRTKGDSNNTADINLVESNNIEGTFKWKIPKFGNVFIFLYKYFLHIIAILLFIMITQLCRHFRKRSEN